MTLTWRQRVLLERVTPRCPMRLSWWLGMTPWQSGGYIKDPDERRNEKQPHKGKMMTTVPVFPRWRNIAISARLPWDDILSRTTLFELFLVQSCIIFESIMGLGSSDPWAPCVFDWGEPPFPQWSTNWQNIVLNLVRLPMLQCSSGFAQQLCDLLKPPKSKNRRLIWGQNYTAAKTPNQTQAISSGSAIVKTGSFQSIGSHRHLSMSESNSKLWKQPRILHCLRVEG